jgi:hypothetical protein
LPVRSGFAELEGRVRRLESQAQPAQEDVTAIVATVVETRDDVRWLKRAVRLLLVHDGLVVERETDEP